MPDAFARLIVDARAFLTELAAHNDRDWFAAHKARYEAELKTPATVLLEQFAHDAGRDSGLTLVPKLFRPQRDVRFSTDKTPYHAHLHMMWSLDGPGAQRPALFFGIAPAYVTTGGGIMGFDKAAQEAWRLAVDGPAGADLAAGIDALERQGFRIEPPELKRVPAPFDAGHPRAGLLRRKSLTLWRDLPEPGWPDPQAALRDCLARLRPLLTRLGGLT